MTHQEIINTIDRIVYDYVYQVQPDDSKLEKVIELTRLARQKFEEEYGEVEK